jgi:hypothetical protein
MGFPHFLDSRFTYGGDFSLTRRKAALYSQEDFLKLISVGS